MATRAVPDADARLINAWLHGNSLEIITRPTYSLLEDLRT